MQNPLDSIGWTGAFSLQPAWGLALDAAKASEVRGYAAADHSRGTEIERGLICEQPIDAGVTTADSGVVARRDHFFKAKASSPVGPV
jgi:hypothetical protein